jgi:hypothetical protein
MARNMRSPARKGWVPDSLKSSSAESATQSCTHRRLACAHSAAEGVQYAKPARKGLVVLAKLSDPERPRTELREEAGVEDLAFLNLPVLRHLVIINPIEYSY